MPESKKHAQVTLWGKYKYDILLDGNESMRDLAFKISLAVHRKENKTKFTTSPRTFNYVYECLLRKSCLNFRLNTDKNDNNESELLKAANELNSKSEYVKTNCEHKTDLEKTQCKKCNGHGYYFSHQSYRLGYTQSNVHIIDIDGENKENMVNVRTFYEKVLECKFTMIKTKNGYWLFSDKKYNDLDEWIYDHCRVLAPGLSFDCFPTYRQKLLRLDEDEQGDFKRATPDKIKASGLYRAPKELNFDVAFTFLSIKRERSTIRITKKSKDDKVILMER